METYIQKPTQNLLFHFSSISLGKSICNSRFTQAAFHTSPDKPLLVPQTDPPYPAIFSKCDIVNIG